MRALASMKTLDLWYSRVDAETLIAQFQSTASAKRRKLMEKNLAKTRAKDSLRAFSKLTTTVDGDPRIAGDPPLIVPVEDLAEGRDVEEFARDVNRGYRRTLQGDRKHLLEHFRYAHAARKVVGVGRVGTRAWIMLMLGRDNDDPLFLQLKEAQPSVLEPFLGKSQYANHGQRVVEGQRLMQAASDIMLGWHRVTGLDNEERDFYFRQLWDNKGSVIIEGMKPRELAAYAEICGRTLARAHARSGDAVSISAYLGSSDAMESALADFAELYADQNELDHAALATAAKTGRINVQQGCRQAAEASSASHHWPYTTFRSHRFPHGAPRRTKAPAVRGFLKYRYRISCLNLATSATSDGVPAAERGERPAGRAKQGAGPSSLLSTGSREDTRLPCCRLKPGVSSRPSRRPAHLLAARLEIGEERVRRDARGETCIRASAGIGQLWDAMRALSGVSFTVAAQ